MLISIQYILQTSFDRGFISVLAELANLFFNVSKARGLKKHMKRLNAPKHWMLGKLDGAFVSQNFLVVYILYFTLFCRLVSLLIFSILCCRLLNHHQDHTNQGNACLWFSFSVTGWSMLWLTVRFNLSWCNVMCLLTTRLGLTRPTQLVSWVSFLFTFMILVFNQYFCFCLCFNVFLFCL